MARLIPTPLRATGHEVLHDLEAPDGDFVSFWREHGAVFLPERSVPWDEGAWARLEKAVREVPHELVLKGDVDDPNHVYVGRILSDPDVVRHHHPNAEVVASILGGPEALAFMGRFLGTPELCLRCVQSHRLEAGCFVGVHVDQDTNRDYDIAAVVHFGGDYQGGAYVVHHPELGDRWYRPKGRGLLVARADTPHQVAVVEAGTRDSLAMFFSRWFGPTRFTSDASRYSSAGLMV